MTTPEFESLAVAVDDEGVLTCRLNRPETLNALTTRDLQDLAALWAAVGDDPSIRAVVITGTGRGFCAGGDVRAMGTGELDVSHVALQSYGSTAWKNLAAVPQPVVAAINGAAVGAGMFFPALADIVISAQEARFGDPHVKRGLVASGAGMLAPSIGLRHTKYLLLLGELIDADEAQRIGLVNRVVPTHEVEETAMTIARRLASYPLEALQWTKKCMNRLLEQSWDLAWETELALEALSATTASHKAAVADFVNSTNGSKS